MSRTPAKFTQADIARATRAALQAGAGSVLLLPDGSIRIGLAPDSLGDKPAPQLEQGKEVVL